MTTYAIIDSMTDIVASISAVTDPYTPPTGYYKVLITGAGQGMTGDSYDPIGMIFTPTIDNLKNWTNTQVGNKFSSETSTASCGSVTVDPATITWELFVTKIQDETPSSNRVLLDINGDFQLVSNSDFLSTYEDYSDNFQKTYDVTFSLYSDIDNNVVTTYGGVVIAIDSYWASDTDRAALTPVREELGLKVDQTTTVNGHALSSNVTVTSTDIGLGNCDNTSDVNKPISTATQTALNAKAATSHTHAESDITNLATDLAKKPTVYFGSTLKSNAVMWTGSSTVSSGVAVVYLTTDGTSTGTAVFPNGPNLDSINAFVSDSTASYQMAYALTNSNKTLTITANKLTTANILTGILGQASANSAVIRLTIWGS